MRKSIDTVQRLMAILDLVPHSPRMLSTGEIHRKLRGLGTDVDIRSVQRDLERLSQRWPITNASKGARNFWCAIDFHYVPRLPPIAHGSARPPATRRRAGKQRTAISSTRRKTPIKPQNFMAVVHEPILSILHERPIAENQIIVPRSKNTAVIRAEIEVTDDFVLWLKRCGPSIVVEAPASLRREMENYAYDYALAYANKGPLLSKEEMTFLQEQSRLLQKGRPKQTVTLHLFARKDVANYIRRNR